MTGPKHPRRGVSEPLRPAPVRDFPGRKGVVHHPALATHAEMVPPVIATVMLARK